VSYKALWQGRIDSEDGSTGHRWHQVVNCESSSDITGGITLIGYPNDAGVAANKGRIGASGGPNALRQFLSNLPWHWQTELTDVGDAEIYSELDKTQGDFANRVARALDSNNQVIGLGGGHDMAWASYQGLSQTTSKKIGIINFDAHLDLRKPAPNASSGTPFRQIADHCQQQNLEFHYTCLGVSKAANTQALFDYAEQSNTRMLFDYEYSLAAAKHTLIPMLQQIDELYVTVCLDAFPVSLCPGVSAPSALGISPRETINILQWLAQACGEYAISWRLSDIAELNPSLDSHNTTARFASRVAFELVNAMIHAK
jgi:formiminoglutamase